jgi:hypothetical protein
MTGTISEAPATGIGKLLAENRFFVPNHQRDYSWTEDEVSQLFDDIDDAIKKNRPLYFLGLMVFLNSDRGLVVLDGQQRLATVVIVLSAIRNWLKQYSSRADEAQKIQDRLIGASEYGETELHPRLTLNTANQDAFYNYVVSSVPLQDINSARNALKRQDRNKRLLEAIEYAHGRIQKIANDTGSPDKAAEYFFGLVKYLRDNVAVVRLVVTSVEVAFTIFETLNDRGRDLSPLDLVKNYLFSKAATGSPERERELEGRWTQMMSTLANVKSDDFLKAFWTSRHGRIRNPELFASLKETYNTANKARSLSIEMLEVAEQYAALESADDPVWAPYSDKVRERVRSLKTIGGQPVHPVILAAFKTMNEREMERLLWLLEVLIVRYQLVGNGNTGRFETTCAKVARSIFAGDVGTASQALQEFKEIFPTDGDFKQNFANKQERNNPKAQYLLRGVERERRRLEHQAIGDELQLGTLTVEHILPRGGGDEWEKVIKADESIVEECVYRLGNLCLLTKVNKDLGRAAFSKKKAVFKQSQILMTKELESYGNWTRAEIEKRQQKMAKLAPTVWRFQ